MSNPQIGYWAFVWKNCTALLAATILFLLVAIGDKSIWPAVWIIALDCVALVAWRIQWNKRLR